jgi:hypothetical protein
MTFKIIFHEKTSTEPVFSFLGNDSPGLALIDEIKASTGTEISIERTIPTNMDVFEVSVTEDFARRYYKLFSDSRVLELFVPRNYLNDYAKWELVGASSARLTINEEWLQECLPDIIDDLCILLGVVNIEDDPEDSLCFKDHLSGDWCLHTSITLLEINSSQPDDTMPAIYGIVPPGEDAYPFATYWLEVVTAYLNKKMLPEGVNNEYLNGEIQNFLEIYHSGNYDMAIYEIPKGVLN